MGSSITHPGMVSRNVGHSPSDTERSSGGEHAQHQNAETVICFMNFIGEMTWKQWKPCVPCHEVSLNGIPPVDLKGGGSQYNKKIEEYIVWSTVLP